MNWTFALCMLDTVRNTGMASSAVLGLLGVVVVCSGIDASGNNVTMPPCNGSDTFLNKILNRCMPCSALCDSGLVRPECKCQEISPRTGGLMEDPDNDGDFTSRRPSPQSGDSGVIDPCGGSCSPVTEYCDKVVHTCHRCVLICSPSHYRGDSFGLQECLTQCPRFLQPKVDDVVQTARTVEPKIPKIESTSLHHLSLHHLHQDVLKFSFKISFGILSLMLAGLVFFTISIVLMSMREKKKSKKDHRRALL